MEQREYKLDFPVVIGINQERVSRKGNIRDVIGTEVRLGVYKEGEDHFCVKAFMDYDSKDLEEILYTSRKDPAFTKPSDRYGVALTVIDNYSRALINGWYCIYLVERKDKVKMNLITRFPNCSG